MTNYICINGKKAELTEEQMKALGIEVPKASPFNRAKGQQYYYIASKGIVDMLREEDDLTDNTLYDIANYCTDRYIMEQRALHETLNRLLWRYSMTHKENIIDNKVYSIKYNHDSKELVSGWVHYKSLYIGEIAFDTKEIANNAIKEIVEPFMKEHPDFKW